MSFGEVTLPVWSVSTIGLAAIGVDEVLLVLEADRSEPPSDDTTAPLMPPLDVLRQMDNMFMSCLTPTKDTIDDKVGIRRCSDRMMRLYSVLCGRLAGIEVAAILLHRPQGQVNSFRVVHNANAKLGFPNVDRSADTVLHRNLREERRDALGDFHSKPIPIPARNSVFMYVCLSSICDWCTSIFRIPYSLA